MVHSIVSFWIPTVNGVLDLNAMPGCKDPGENRNHKTLCCLCCASGPISAVIHTNRTGYVPGKWTLFILRARVSTGAKGAWHLWNFWTVMSGTRWFWQFYYIIFCFTLEFWGFTSDWPPLFQIPNSSPDTVLICMYVLMYLYYYRNR